MTDEWRMNHYLPVWCLKCRLRNTLKSRSSASYILSWVKVRPPCLHSALLPGRCLLLICNANNAFLFKLSGRPIQGAERIKGSFSDEEKKTMSQDKYYAHTVTIENEKTQNEIKNKCWREKPESKRMGRRKGNTKVEKENKNHQIGEGEYKWKKQMVKKKTAEIRMKWYQERQEKVKGRNQGKGWIPHISLPVS